MRVDQLHRVHEQIAGDEQRGAIRLDQHGLMTGCVPRCGDDPHLGRQLAVAVHNG